MGSPGDFPQKIANWDVKSFRIKPGFKISYWSKPDFIGDTVSISSDVPNFNFKFNSFKIAQV